MGLAETAELAVRISLKDNASAGLRGLQRNVGGLSSSLSRAGRGVGQIGTGLARAGLLLGGAAITGIAAASKAAIDFEDAFAGVKKTVSEDELKSAGLTFDDLATAFRNMATEIPIAASDLARLGETAGALGVRVQDIDDFVRVTALLGETTDLTADQAAESLGKVGTILGLTGKEYEHFADILVNLGNKGASTESEILEVAKRFAGVGRQAGLTNEQVLALSSTITSLGAEPEAGGSALSRIFSNMATEIANATKKGKAFSKLTGDSLEELAKRINKGDALGIFQETLDSIAKMSRTEQASVLKALGITNVRDRDAIIKMANDTKVLDKNLENAGASATGALGIEAQKRFDTTRSKLALVVANAKELAFTFGYEVLPSIKRAAKGAIEFLSDPAIKEQARELGRDVASFIDNINWDDVKRGATGFVDLLRGAADWAGKILGILDKLPGEVKAAAAGFLVLNKLSGGLLGAGVGNVVGGVVESAVRGLGSKLPGVGRLFAQPVFVTNWPVGGLGGGGGVAGVAGKGGIGLLGKMFLVGEAIGLIAAVKEVADNVTGAAHEQAVGIHETLKESLASPQSTQDLQTKLAGIDSGIKQINDMGNIPAALFHDTLVELESMHMEVVAAIKAQTAQDKTSREDQPADETAKEIKEQRKEDRRAARQARRDAEKTLEAIRKSRITKDDLNTVVGHIRWKPSDVVQIEDRRDPLSTARDKTAREDMPADTLKGVLEAVKNSADSDEAGLPFLRNIAKNTRDDPEETSKKNQKHFERVRNQISESKIATIQKLAEGKAATQEVRQRIDVARVAQIASTAANAVRVASAEASAADRIVAAIRALDLSVVVAANVSVSGSHYQASGTVVKNTGSSGGTKRHA